MSKKNSDSITLSPKHGVNPTIPICFFCGKEKNEIALLGKLPNDAEAPHSMWLPGDYTPCDECQKKFDTGITLMEVDDAPTFTNQPPISGEHYPTGRIVVIKEEAVRRIFTEEAANDIIKHRKAFLDKESMNMILK